MDKESLLGGYTEVCNTIRHYSNASLAVRLASVGQGFAVLAAWAVALSEDLGWVTIYFPVVGVVFTVLLYRFHMGYFEAAGFFYQTAEEIEKRLFDGDLAPFASYARRHDELFSTWASRAFTLNAPFSLVGVAFLFAAIVTVIVQLNAC